MNFSKAALIQLATALVSVTVVGLLVVRTSTALFTSQTANTSNSWQTGSVLLGDDDTGSALFDATADGHLTGGQVLTRCIAVTYTGSSTSGVAARMYASAAGPLASYLDLRVREGTG